MEVYIYQHMHISAEMYSTRRIAMMRSDSLCSRIRRRRHVKTAASRRRFSRISAHHYHAPSHGCVFIYRLPTPILSVHFFSFR